MDKKPAREIKYAAPDSGMILIGVLVVFITLGKICISKGVKSFINRQHFPAVLLYVYKKKKTSRSDILLLGLCESGKTKLYTLLMGAGGKETFTSIKENVGSYTAKNVSG